MRSLTRVTRTFEPMLIAAWDMACKAWKVGVTLTVMPRDPFNSSWSPFV